ncbi:MAG TPA: hypothetical protein VFS21_01470 [Roseiflexaceae bacterium]|nr:hypothetical protein [Roseiflexaceae bacterium]
MSHHESVLRVLEHATADLRRQIAALPTVRAVVAGALPPDSRQMLGRIQRIIAPVLAQAAPHHAALELLPPGHPAHEPADHTIDSEGVLRAHILAWTLQEHIRQRPVAALGALYLVPATPALWPDAAQTEAAQLLEIALDENGRQAALAVARDGLEQLAAMLAAFEPRDQRGPGELATALNPAAGQHAIPTDLRELHAALRAGLRSWEAFPYYAWRYGQRGRQFTRSDSAWLVTLSDQPAASRERQIDWLARVLAARGMPTWLLACHLEALHEELVAAIPEQAGRYATLGESALRLHTARRRHLSDARLGQLAAAFEARIPPEWREQLPACGGILATAVADERGGIPKALSSIAAWMTDPARFPPAWIAAAEWVIHEAERETGG